MPPLGGKNAALPLPPIVHLDASVIPVMMAANPVPMIRTRGCTTPTMEITIGKRHHDYKPLPRLKWAAPMV